MDVADWRLSTEADWRMRMSIPVIPSPDPKNPALDYGLKPGAQSYAGVGLRIAAYCMDVALSVLSVSVPVYLILELLIRIGIWVPGQRTLGWEGWRYVVVIA